MTQAATNARPPGRIKSALLGAVAGWFGRHVVLGDPFAGALGASDAWSGQRVTVNSALQLSAAWACVRLISETVSTLPFGLYRRAGDGSRTAASDHPLYGLLHHQPNADMTAVSFWQAIFASLLLWGRACVEKRYMGTTLVALDFLMPDLVSCRRLASGTVVWEYADPATGRVREIPESGMWYTPAFSIDGINGLSPISYGAHVFGGAMAAERAASETFKNGMKSPGLVTMNSILKAEQREDVRKHVATVGRQGGIMVLEAGASFQALQMNPEDAELLATRGFGVEEVCRWFRVPPFMIGHAEKSTSWGTGIEQQMIGFITFVLRPWCVRVEQSMRRSLLTPAERQTMSGEFALEGLLRGDSASRATFYSQMTQNGIYTRDDCRRKENMPTIGGNADVLTVQSNLLPIDQLGAAPPGTTTADALKAWLGLEEKGNSQ